MVEPAKLLFLLTDGGRARFLQRSPRDGHYVTLEEVDATPRLRTLRDELRASPPGRSISSTSPRRSDVGPEDYLRPAKEAFVGEVADRAAKVCERDGFAGIVVVAPARLIGLLKRRLEGRVTIAGVVRKDLTKTPGSELGAWLNNIFANPQTTR